MMVPLVCPATHERLEERGEELISVPSANRYPVLRGIPIMLPSLQDRQRVAMTNWDVPKSGDTPLDFYNVASYSAEAPTGTTERRTIEQAFLQVQGASGPVLEIGSGAGRLLVFGCVLLLGCDYSFTSLRDYIAPRYQRVCATAEELPFADGTFALVYTVAALEHVPRADLAFAEIDRVLRPGGVAVVWPAWHCRQYRCDGIPYLPYEKLTFMQKLTRLTIPLRENKLLRAGVTLPQRLARRVAWAARGRRPVQFRFRKLRPNYYTPLGADSDACSSLDSHEGCLFFHSRNYDMLNPGARASEQLLARHIGLVVRKRM
jgi:SAM-dependent methyltransferase